MAFLNQDNAREAEWDLQSMKRYEQLLMFEAEYPVKEMELLGEDNWLCCLCEKTTKGVKSSVLTVYSLPPRLRKNDSKASLSPNFDLKITAGAFTNKNITQISCLRSSDYLFASEQDVEEILMYRLNTNESDRLVMSGVLNCDGLVNPNISSGCGKIIASSCSGEKISVIDIRNKTEMEKCTWPTSHSKPVCLKTLILSTNLILVYSTTDAESVLYDMRQRNPATIMQGFKEGSLWSAGCDFEESTNIETKNIGYISSNGLAKFYDIKNTSTCSSQINLGSHLHHNSSSNYQNGSKIHNKAPNIKLSPLIESSASVSGLDSRVYVIDTNPCSITFQHDGHEHMESCLGSDTMTTSHVYFSPGGEKTLISSSDNSSINCWSYNTTYT